MSLTAEGKSAEGGDTSMSEASVGVIVVCCETFETIDCFIVKIS